MVLGLEKSYSLHGNVMVLHTKGGKNKSQRNSHYMCKNRINPLIFPQLIFLISSHLHARSSERNI